ncbi:MAG: aminoacyl-tRNA hydrolase [Candidatus Omnitrophota bacterium]
MKLIVGLGNPGRSYSRTRHNIGRLLIESILDSRSASAVKNRKLQASCREISWQGSPVVLAYPEVFMNISGEAVASLADYFEAEVSRDLLVVVDDAALDFGKMRLRSCGSDGGHKGLKSIETCLGSRDYARLRLGIGCPEEGASDEGLKDYVLGVFLKEEERALEGFLKQACEACALWISQPIGKAMSFVNTSKQKG